LLQDELNHPSLFWLNGRLRQRPYPILSIVHHLRSSEKRPSWQNRFYRWIEKRYLRSVDGFIFNSETTRRVVEGLSGAGRPFVVAYPAGDRFGQHLDEAAVRERALQPGPLRILFVGHLIPRKGLDTLLAAVATLPPATWRLDVAGSTTVDAAYTRRIKRLIQEAKVSEPVRLHGSLSGNSLAGLLQTSHVMVVPSSYEGFGIVYLEGMGFGLPAVATTAGAAGEIITDGHNGFLIREGEVTILAQRIAQLSADRERLAQMGTAALARYEAHPTWEETAAVIRHFICNMTI
jgi:glycosyltransferase involved in cell wall biosynthesis